METADWITRETQEFHGRTRIENNLIILCVLRRIAKIITKRNISKRKYRLKMTTQDTSTRRRVKLYALNADRQWDDRGTGHVTSNYVDRLKGESLRLTFHSIRDNISST